MLVCLLCRTANYFATVKMAQFEVEAFTLLAIALVAIAIRVAARWTTAGPGNFQLDDYLMPLAGVLPFTFCQVLLSSKY